MAQQQQQHVTVGFGEFKATIDTVALVYKEPETRYLPNGNMVVNVTIVVPGRGYSYYRVSIFGNLAVEIDRAVQDGLCGPGSKVATWGRVETEWFDTDDGRRQSQAVNASGFIVLTDPDQDFVHAIIADQRAMRDNDQGGQQQRQQGQQNNREGNNRGGSSQRGGNRRPSNRGGTNEPAY